MSISLSTLFVAIMIFALHRALICADDRLASAMWVWLGSAALSLVLAVWPNPLQLLDLLVGALAYGMGLVVTTAIWVAARSRKAGAR